MPFQALSETIPGNIATCEKLALDGVKLNCCVRVSSFRPHFCNRPEKLV